MHYENLGRNDPIYMSNGQPITFEKQDMVDLVGKLPKYPKSFSTNYIKKLQNSYNEYQLAKEEYEYQRELNKFEGRDINLEKPVKTFDESEVQELMKPHPLYKTWKVEPLQQNENSLKRKQFHCPSVIPKGLVIPMHDKAVIYRHEEKMKKIGERIVKSDKIDDIMKVRKTRALSQVSREKSEQKQKELLELGAKCHQKWATSRLLPKPVSVNKPERPITATTQEALNELDEYDQTLKIKRKEQMKLLASQRELIKTARENGLHTPTLVPQDESNLFTQTAATNILTLQ